MLHSQITTQKLIYHQCILILNCPINFSLVKSEWFHMYPCIITWKKIQYKYEWCGVCSMPQIYVNTVFTMRHDFGRNSCDFDNRCERSISLLYFTVIVGGTTITAFGCCVMAALFLYYYFARDTNCHRNQWFIFINLGSCLIVSIIAVFKRGKQYLYHVSLISWKVVLWSQGIRLPRVC